jgi:hypothetical protein
MQVRRRGARVVSAGSDKVLFGVSLPSDTSIANIRARMSMEAVSVTVNQKVNAYGVEGWVLPVTDPDASTTYQTLWDQLVPKDTDVQTIDLDTGAVDSAPFFEPGEADWTQLLNLGVRPRRIYQRLRFLTLGSTSSLVLDSSNGIKWLAKDNWTIRLDRPFRVNRPSVLVFGFASPGLDDTTTSEEGPLAENEWGQVKYIGHVVDRAFMDLLGLTEAGAETPWEEATDLLQKHMEPDIFEDTGGQMEAQNFFTYTDAIMEHRVPGEVARPQLTTGR